MYDIGVSGTRQGASKRQLLVISDIIEKCHDERPDEVTVHEGCCNGFDDQLTIHVVLGIQRIHVCGHPPIDKKLVRPDHHLLHDITMPDGEYLDRNDDIIRHGKDRIIAAPFQEREVHRGSGTWTVIRRAVKAGRKVDVVYRTGTIRSGSEALER